MLTKEGCEKRRKRLWKRVPTAISQILIADPRHVYYLTNFLVSPIGFSAGERGLLLLERDAGATLLCDNFSRISSLTTPYVENEIIEPWYDHKHSVQNRDHALFQAVEKIFRRLKPNGFLFEGEWLPVECLGFLPKNAFEEEISLGDLLRDLRREKQPDEIELIKKCIRAGEAGHRRARELIQPGKTELEIYLEVQHASLAEAGIPGIVYGDFRRLNGQQPSAGGLPTTDKLEETDLFVLDFSVMLHGYRGDFTNTYALGNPSAKQREMEKACLAAIKAGEEVLKAGVPANEVYRAVSNPLEEAGFGPLVHHAGHGIGLAHPEYPILVPENNDPLRTGDVITIEPGIYLDGVGGMRFEHNFLLTEDGCERLTNHRLGLTF